MITYFYWAIVLLIAVAILASFAKAGQWLVAVGGFIAVMAIGSLAYYFHFQQVFVKNYGGVMSVTVPEGQRHVAATWKDNNLWIENYDPATNTCHFNEYSKGNLLQGKVIIKNCSPVALGEARATPSP
ncbi:hypothetical protein [Halioxenophilus aromaticivorans]|uniref:NfeD-like C-terminal domain-containing protein n=1 Tax=Halioxenophilus aromaticivorans TaxID=1306992 RepID=A0AAV3U8S5_9ALTE